MDSKSRTIAKALTWQLLGLVTMTLLAWATTGDLAAGGGLALAGAGTGLIMYTLHERVWARIRWGRQNR